MGTEYQIRPSEIKQIEKMLFKQVAPVAVESLQPPPPPVRPEKSSPAVKSICRNLFGSTDPRKIEAMFWSEQKRQIEYVKERFNIDLEETCNQQISTALNKCDSETKHFAASSPYARQQGIKRTYKVRKANNAISNVPKRIRDNISSEMGATGQKEKDAQKQKQKEMEEEEEKQTEKEKPAVAEAEAEEEK